MEPNFEKAIQERAVLVGLNADCFTKAQTASDETLEELEALLETAGGFCTAKILQIAILLTPTALSARARLRRFGC